MRSARINSFVADNVLSPPVKGADTFKTFIKGANVLHHAVLAPLSYSLRYTNRILNSFVFETLVVEVYGSSLIL